VERLGVDIMNDGVMAYFITWTCYGTYLPGDARGWVKWRKGDQVPQPTLEAWCCGQMSESAVFLVPSQRSIVEQAVRDHSEIRQWDLRAVNCRSNHCHAVVIAPGYDGELVREQFKSWSTRGLKEQQRQSGVDADKLRLHWWTRGGFVGDLCDEEVIEAAVKYTLEAQDFGGSKGTS